MTNKIVSRRNFLKLAGLSMGSLAFSPMLEPRPNNRKHRLMRVASDNPVVIRQQPTDEYNNILYQRFKDDLINVYDEIESEYGPGWNPYWYRVWGGYVHSGYLQEVKHVLNPVTDTIHQDGQLGEITVPFSRSYRYTSARGWERVYRLYYQTTHRIIDIITGPDGKPWYELQHQIMNNIQYAVPAEHMRIVEDSEFDPISPDVPPGEKRVVISIARQMLTAYEGDEIVFSTNVSTGRLTPQLQTPTGNFRVDPKHPSKHMGNSFLTDNILDYVLPGVPWNCFFEWEGGIASHGTYWHNNFGIPMSLGCVNMRNHEAKWLYRWTTPYAEPRQWVVNGAGTRVTVQ